MNINKIVNEIIKKESEHRRGHRGESSEIFDDYRLFSDYVEENYDISDNEMIEEIYELVLEGLGE